MHTDLQISSCWEGPMIADHDLVNKRLTIMDAEVSTHTFLTMIIEESVCFMSCEPFFLCTQICRFLVVGNIFRLETCMNSLVNVPSYSILNFQGTIVFTQNWCNILL
jgi:hypothetical protein